MQIQPKGEREEKIMIMIKNKIHLLRNECGWQIFFNCKSEHI